MKIKTVEELLEWLHHQRDTKIEFPNRGRVRFHIYSRKLIGGGVEGNLWFGLTLNEADMKLQEERPGALTVAVVPCKGESINHTMRKSFGPDTPLEALREAFPDGRNIDLIVDELLAVDGD